MDRITTYDGQVAEAVRVEIARANLTVSHVATKSGMPRNTLARRLRAEQPFTLGQLQLIASTIGVPLAALIPERSAA